MTATENEMEIKAAVIIGQKWSVVMLGSDGITAGRQVVWPLRGISWVVSKRWIASSQLYKVMENSLVLIYWNTNLMKNCLLNPEEIFL